MRQQTRRGQCKREQRLARWKSAQKEAGSGTSSELISQRRPKSCSAGIVLDLWQAGRSRSTCRRCCRRCRAAPHNLCPALLRYKPNWLQCWCTRVSRARNQGETTCPITFLHSFAVADTLSQLERCLEKKYRHRLHHGEISGAIRHLGILGRLPKATHCKLNCALLIHSPCGLGRSGSLVPFCLPKAPQRD